MIDTWEQGALEDRWAKDPAAAGGLEADERRFLAVIGKRRRGSTPPMAVTDLTERAADAAARASTGSRCLPPGPRSRWRGTPVCSPSTASVAVGAAILRRRRLATPTWSDVALIGMATHQISRRLTKDAVTSPLRAPFTTYERSQGNAEVEEKVRGSGFRHAVGELVTCPFCLAQWIATGLRSFSCAQGGPLVAGTFASLLLSDLLQFVRTGFDQATRQDNS